MPSEAPAGFVKAGAMVDDEFQPGFLCYGVPIGTDKYVSTMLDLQLDEMEGEIHKMQEVLEPSRQSMWALLRSSICQRLDFWLTMVYPSQMEKCAERMDNLIINAIQKLLGSQNGTRTNVGQTNVGEDKRRTDKRRTDKRRIGQT